jgi:hypothetical protein
MTVICSVTGACPLDERVEETFQIDNFLCRSGNPRFVLLSDKRSLHFPGRSGHISHHTGISANLYDILSRPFPFSPPTLFVISKFQMWTYNQERFFPCVKMRYMVYKAHPQYLKNATTISAGYPWHTLIYLKMGQPAFTGHAF